MDTAKIFMNGRSEAVRLPKDYRFDAKEVFIKRFGDVVLLVPKKKMWNVFLEGLNDFSEDFPGGRLTDKPQEQAEL